MINNRKVLLLFAVMALMISVLGINTYAASDIAQIETVYGESYLATDENAAYTAIYNGLYSSQAQISVQTYNLNADQASALCFKIIYENPELFYVKSYMEYSYNSKGIILSICPQYTISGSALVSAKQVYQSEIAKIMGSVSSFLSNLEKVLYVNDYFATHFRYDTTYTYVDAYSLLTKKTGVCQAYTSAFIAVMNELNIPVSYASSQDMDHIWNLVYIDNSWYHIDVTWNDPVSDMPGRSCHNNFLLSDAAIKTTGHYNWTSEYVCSSTKYDSYFWKDISAPFAYTNNSWYYVNKSDYHLYSYNFGNNTGSSLLNIDKTWPVMDNPEYFWMDCFSGLVSYNGILYYNTPTQICAYNPSSGTNTVMSEPDCSAGYIYYMTVNNSTLTYYLNTSPTGNTVGSGNLDLSKIACAHTSTYERITPATCAVDGKTETICSFCGTVISTNVIVATGEHSYGDWVITQPATETQEGLRVKVCSVCGKVVSEVIPKLSSIITAVSVPYFINSKDNTIYIGFSAYINGTIKYIAPSGVQVYFKENAKSFNDTTSHWAKDNINFAVEREIFYGTDDGMFSPDAGMTRAMFATVIGRIYERSFGEINASGTRTFTDVNYSAYYGNYVDWAAENKIISGVGGGQFEPDRQISREEMATILYRFAKFLNIATEIPAATQLTYPDAASISSWAVDAAKYCQITGIIAGRDAGNFEPGGTATRAEVATILRRFIISALS